MVKHSQDKEKFLKVSIKRMQETQMFEDELKEANEYYLVLFAWLQELEAKLSEESQFKNGKFLLPFYLGNQVIFEYTLDWSWPCLAEYKDQLIALGIILSAPDSETKALADLKTDLDEEKAARIASQNWSTRTFLGSPRPEDLCR
jgi:hypothetical protein